MIRRSKIRSGLQEYSGVVSHGSDILNVYTDEVASSQNATNLGLNKHKHLQGLQHSIPQTYGGSSVHYGCLIELTELSKE